MRTKLMAVCISAAALMLMAVASAWTSPATAQSIPTDAQATCTVSAATFAGWFQSGTVTLNGVVNPANSVTLPNVPNCSFYQWSKQMFLWLTSPAPATYGGGGGRIFDSPTFYDVSPLNASGQRTLIPHTPGLIRAFPLRAAQVGPHNLPVITDTAGRLFEIESTQVEPATKPLIRSKAGKMIAIESVRLGANGKPVFLDKAGKTIATQALTLKAAAQVRTVRRIIINRIPIFLDSSGNVIDTEEGQADLSVLVAQNGSLVYYATIVNDVYAYFLTGAKDGKITPSNSFPTTAANLAQITAFASAHGVTFPDPNALAIEVKSAWIEAAGLPNLSSYITMQATIPTYNTSSSTSWTVTGQKTVELALVGIHVVGSTAGHPEMIWSTFEHFGNAPNAAYSYNSTAGTKTVPQNTAGTWLFSTSGSGGPFNIVHAQNLTGADITAVSGQTISPSDTMRIKPWGGAANASPNPLDSTAAASNTEIISINNSISSMMPSGDVRNNYFMTGATWTIGGASPTSNFGNPGNTGGNTVGTSQLNNTTMETYQQGTTAFVANGSNCFACHVTNSTLVSHVFADIQPLF